MVPNWIFDIFLGAELGDTTTFRCVATGAIIVAITVYGEMNYLAFVMLALVDATGVLSLYLSSQTMNRFRSFFDYGVTPMRIDEKDTQSRLK